MTAFTKNNKRIRRASFIIVSVIILVVVIGRNADDFPILRSLANQGHESKQLPVEQAKFSATGCTDKAYIVEASEIAHGAMRVSTDYRDELWQRGGCSSLAATLRLTVLGRETLATPVGTYRMVKVSINNSAGSLLKYFHYVYDEPLYVMQDDIRPLNPMEDDHSYSPLG